MKKEQYFNEIIGNFIQDAAMDSCPILHKKADTKYRFLRGTRKIQPVDAKYLYANRDKEKFSHWIADRTEECDSYDAVAKWLHDKSKIDSSYVDALFMIFSPSIRHKQIYLLRSRSLAHILSHCGTSRSS